MRRAVAAGVGVLILILLVLGVRGCLNARKERSFENYVSDLSSIAAETQNLSQQFFKRLQDPGGLSALEFEAEVKADRGAMEGLLDRAENLDAPDELAEAQDLIVLSYELRRDGMAAISELLPIALGDQGADKAIKGISEEMRTFLASDVLYTKGQEQIEEELTAQEIAYDPETEPISTQFLPAEPNWLDPDEVAAALGGTLSSGDEEAAPGLHGLGLVEGGVLLQPTGAALADGVPVTAAADGAELEVQVENQGDNDETRRRRHLRAPRRWLRRGDDRRDRRRRDRDGQPAGRGGGGLDRRAHGLGRPGPRRGDRGEQHAHRRGHLRVGRLSCGSRVGAVRRMRPVSELDSTTGIVALGAAAVAVVALIAVAALAIRLRRIRHAQSTVLGDSERDIVLHAADLERKLADDARRLEAASAGLEERIEAAERRLDTVVSRTAVIRYDAYNEMTGRQSSSIAMLDDAATGHRALVDPAPRAGALLRQVGDRGRVRARSLPGGARGDHRGHVGQPGPAFHRRGTRPAARGQGDVTSVAFLGPGGTFSEDALLAATGDARFEEVAKPTIFEAIQAVANGEVDRALVPFENSIEGSVRVTLDALAFDVEGVAIVGEHDHAIRHALISKHGIRMGEIEVVLSHPQANAQCARFIRERLPGAAVRAVSSTAEAVRSVSLSKAPWGALGAPSAARLYDCEVLAEGVEDAPDNVTRFVWLAREDDADAAVDDRNGNVWRTTLVFSELGADHPGALVEALTEFSSRDVNLTRIESRPLRRGLGRYLFFVDLEGRCR